MVILCNIVLFFFFQAEDGIRDRNVTGVQTCALPISGVCPSPAYSYSACVVDLDADPRTGLIHVNKVWIAHDVGRAINPLLVEGQVEGSVYMGLGEALMEDRKSTRLNSSHVSISYAVFCLKK